MASSSTYNCDFPTLPGSVATYSPGHSPLNFISNLTNHDPIANKFAVSFINPAARVPFSAADLDLGVPDWKHTLVGYSVGPRPTYLSLQSAIRKVWSLKGAVELLSLNDGFFLFKFASPEDFETVWTGGPWFLFGRPFILQQWTPKFKPRLEECNSIPIWIKIVDLPLAVWNPLGISKIASFVSHPLAVDALTARKTRLTYARVCVMVTKESSFPDEIPISMDGDEMSLQVLYDWKPTPCAGCGSLVHPSSLCHKNPQPKPPAKPQARGRSSSRARPALLPPKVPVPQPNPPLLPSSVISATADSTALLPSSVILANADSTSQDPTPLNTVVITQTQDMNIGDSATPRILLPNPQPDISTSVHPVEDPIPNLNSPIDVASSSEQIPSTSTENSQSTRSWFPRPGFLLSADC
ncbi:uncharacterized protein LOC110098388 [Dendrobium catenatum]|uniref:uncharacterized protein LOC110098388 n=1 Tax=Dendrobium catenatum TaxID=906689 RepID=UPI00109FA1C9|nr:uncharacterized protein LOC110098388 [Dendrobium catenatum]